jgi:ATP-dependent DNA helicase RecG
MEIVELKKLVDILVASPHETEWMEFKHNFHSPEEIGERISAISNSACLLNKPYGYIVFGIDDNTHQIIGTNFHAKNHKKGNEELEMWLANRLNPHIDFESYEFDYDKTIHISLYKIPAAVNHPITFLNKAYIRVGSLTKLLIGYPDKEAKIWRKSNQKPLESIIVKKDLSINNVISLLSVETYFDLMNLPMPQTSQGIIERFKSEHLVVEDEVGYSITELGAIVLAKDLKNFDSLRRKAVRVIIYKGKGKLETVREQIFEQGYAVCFSDLMNWVNGQLPANEEIGKALRREVRMYPEIALREIVAKMIIHQDLAELGFPMIEIYSDRIEISNPGTPLISTERFIDEYQSRNESLADLMRRLGFCEEKGSGMDKAITANELYQLPAVRFQVQEKRTTVSIFAYKGWSETNKEERIQACYQHTCLKYVSNEMMTNQTLRERFGIDAKNYSMVSRLIKDSINKKLIKEGNPENKSNRLVGYIPYWA